MSRYSRSIIFFILLFTLSIIKFTLAVDFILQGVIRETFDDNINSIVETPFEKKKYDFITEAVVGLGIRHEGKTDTLDIVGHVFQQVYAKNFKEKNKFKNNFQDITLDYTKAFSEVVSFHVIDVFQNYPEPDRFEALFGNAQGRMRYWRNNFNFLGTIEITSLYTISLQYLNQFSKYFYTRPMSSYLSNFYSGISVDQKVNMSLMQIAQIRNELHWDAANNSFIFYEYQWSKPYPGKLLQVHRPGVGYRHDFTRQLFIEGRVAIDIVLPSYYVRYRVNAYNQQIIKSPRTYQTLFANLILSNNVDKKTNASLSFTYQNSILANTLDAATNWQILGDVIRHIFPRVLLTSSVFYGEGYIYATNATNRLFGINLSLAYELTEHISAAVYYNFILNYTHVTGNYITAGYVWNNRVGYAKEDTGYYRNRASLIFSAEF